MDTHIASIYVYISLIPVVCVVQNYAVATTQITV